MTSTTCDLRVQRAAMMGEVAKQASIIDKNDPFAVPNAPTDPSQLKDWFIEQMKRLFERDVNQARQHNIVSALGLEQPTAEEVAQIRKLHEGVLESNIRKIEAVANKAKSQGRTASLEEYCSALIVGVYQHNQATIKGKEYSCANPGCGNVTSLPLKCEKCRSAIYCRQACKNADRLAHERVCQLKPEKKDQKAKRQENAPSLPATSGQLNPARVVSISGQEHTCANTACGKTSDKIVLCCKRCREAFYCDRNCQVAHWKAGHKTICVQKETAKGAGL